MMLTKKVQLDILSILGSTINVTIGSTVEGHAEGDRQEPSTHLSIEEKARMMDGSVWC